MIEPFEANAKREPSGLVVPGYSPHGPETTGAAYARAHPNDAPDLPSNAPREAQPGYSCSVAGRHALRFVVGTSVQWLGKSRAAVRAVTVAAVILDTRALTAERLAELVDVGRLVLWRGVYWQCTAVNGVFVTLEFWGPGVKRKGRRVYYRKGHPYGHRVQDDNVQPRVKP